ncbi:dystonin [Discoglossus pictus]
MAYHSASPSYVQSDEQEYLQAYEDVLERYKDERDKVQKKTFTKWINQHLMKVRKHVNDLYEDLRDGHNLISLLEVLSGDSLPRERDFLKTLRLPREKGRMRFHRLQNVQIALDYLKKRQVKLVNIRNDDITDGNPKLTLGLIWTIILHFQISDIHVTGESEDMSAKEKLLLWTRQAAEGYHGIRCENFTTCWRDGRLFNAIIHKYRPDLIDLDAVAVQSNITNLENAFYVAENLGVTRLLDPEDVDVSSPDEKSVITYVSSMYDVFPKTPEGGEGISANDIEVKWIEYQNMVNYLIQWIRHHVVLMSDRTFPNTAVELKALYQQYLQFKENEIPPKETEKSKIKHLYTLLEPWIEFGRIKLCQGFHPNDIEKEWGKLIIAMFEREKTIRPEIERRPDEADRSQHDTGIKMNSTCYGYYSSDSLLTNSNRTSVGSNENLLSVKCGPTIINSYISFGSEQSGEPRLEMLQQIANRVQRDSLGCEDKLILARTALQADAKRIESGIQCQNEAEVTGYIIECENLLRQQVVDVQALVDGKFYQSDQLVQRVASLRDELLATRNEYSSVYSKGRMLTSDQTQLMISGISQSLNSGFSQSLNPMMNSSMSHGMTPVMNSSMSHGMTPMMNSSMSHGMTPGMNSSMSHGMTPTMTPSSLTPGFSQGFNSHFAAPMSPTLTPSFSPGLIPNYAPGMNSNALQSLRLMQVKKPLPKSSLDKNLPEEEANLRFVQDLLSWVDEMQVQLDRAEWGSDLSSIESQLENHKNFQGAIEEFETSLKEAKMSELQINGPLKGEYSEALHDLESQYSKLLNCTRSRQKNLDSLYSFVSRATRELIWLNEKEEEEVAYDWSDRNQNITSKKDYHADLMRELDEKEDAMKTVQDIAEQMLLQNHPARSSIEAYKSAMQTQWNWILQLCHCVEQHIRQNSAYFEYFNDSRDATDFLKGLKDAILRKYSCDKSTSVHKLEDLVQESMEEKEQLLQYKNTVASLVGRAKAIVQLKPRNPDNSLKASIAVRAICDYRQIEITIYKDDECVLASNSHRAKWKVISPTGNEAMVPSVCFTVPSPNKEAIDTASRLEQMYQSVLTLWHESHVNMKSMVSWHYLMSEIEAIRASKVSSIKTMLPGEHQQIMGNLKSRFDEFLEDSQESKIFSVSDIGQLEREVNVCKLYYEELLKSAEREEQEESVYNLYVSELRNFRLRLENLEERLVRQIRTPLDRDDLHESVIRISEQEKLKKDLDHLKDDLSSLSSKCQEFLSHAANSPSIETLRTQLNTIVQSMNQVYSMSSIYLEKLKTINLVLKNTQGAESLVKLYETKLCEEDAITADRNSIDRLIATLKNWRSEVDEKREAFHTLEDELQKSKSISDQMFKLHKERDLDFDWHKEKADQLAERWQNVQSQIENRLRDLDGINKSLKYYKECFVTLNSWIKKVEDTQNTIQANIPDNSKSLAKQLEQMKMLISEIEMKQSKMDECHKYSEQYCSSIKDYELQLMTYRALVDSHQKSPMRRRKIQSSSDVIIQEYMNLRTRYTALMTLFTQLIKFSEDSFKRMEEEETRRYADQSASSADLTEQQKISTEENSKLLKKIQELEMMLEEMKKQKYILEQEVVKVKSTADMEMIKHQKTIEEISLQKTKAEYEAQQFRLELETTVKQKTAIEQQLEHVRQITRQAESKRDAVEDKLRAFKTQIEESTTSRRRLEEHLKRKDIDLQDLEHKKINLMGELKRKADIEDELLRQVKQLEHDLAYQKKMVEKDKLEYESKRQLADSKYSFSTSKEYLIPTRSTVQEVQYIIDSEVRGPQIEQYAKKAETLKLQLDDLTLVNKKAENEIKQYKSELSSLQVHKAAADEKSRQLRIQLDDTHSMLQQLRNELEQKNQMEQNYILQLRELERKLYHSQDKAEEVMQEATDLKKVRNTFEEELKSLQQSKVSLEHKIKMQKSDYDDVREKLKVCQEELRQKDMSERNSQQKISFLEDDLNRKKQEVDSFRKRVDELVRLQAKSESSVKHMNSQISTLQQEKSAAEQRSQSRSGEADTLREQLKKTQEELHYNARTQKEEQQKMLKLQDELTKNTQWGNTLKIKLDELTKLNSETEMSLRKVKSDAEKTAMEKNSLQKNVDMLRAQLDSSKEQLRMTKDQLQKLSKSEQDAQNMVKRLEDELIKSRNAFNEVKQKCDKQNLTILNFEKDIRNLKSELNNLTVEKRMADQKIQLHQGHLQELNTKLKKAQDDLHKKTVEEQLAQKKLSLYHEESLKHKHSAEEFRKKLEKTMESNLSTESDFSNMRLELVGLKQEKSMYEEKIRLLKVEVSELQGRFQKCQEQLNQEKKTVIEHVQRIRRLEEELEVHKRSIESMKLKFDSHRQEHINQLRLLQTEIQQNNSLNSPVLKAENGNSFMYSSSGSLKDFDQFHHRTITSPVLRRKFESKTDVGSPFFKTEVDERKMRVDGYDESVQKDLQHQLSRIKQSLDVTDSKKPFTEYVTQKSTELQISIDSKNPYRHLSELENIKDKSIQNAIQTFRIEEEKLGKELGKFEQPMEIVKNSKQYDVLVEVTTVKQEKEILISNEDQVFEEHNSLDGFPKTNYMSSSFKKYSVSDGFMNDSSSTDKFIFQGLRNSVSARQMVEAKILDLKTMEQLESGRTSVQEVQIALDKYLTKATAIAGLYLESSKEKLSFTLAVKKGLIDKNLAFEFLEAQVITGFIIDPVTGKTYSVEEAILNGIVDQEFKEKLLESEKAVLGYIYSGRKLSVFQAIEARLLERQRGKRMLEAQIASGGVIDPVKSIRIPAEVAVLKGLVNHTTLKFLHEPASNAKGFHFPISKQSMYYSDLLQLCVMDLDSKTFLLPIGERKITAFSAENGQKICVVDMKSGIEMTRFEAYERGLIDQHIYFELSQNECQWESSTYYDSDGNAHNQLTDQKTGRQFLLDEAVTQRRIESSQVAKFKEGLISATELADLLVSKSKPGKDPNSPIAGCWVNETNERVSIFKAVRRNLLDRITLHRCLEAQASTGGIIDPGNGKKYKVSVALQKGLIDDICAKQIQQFELAFTGIIDPVSKAVMTTSEAMSMNMLNKEVGQRCLEYQYVTGGVIDPRSHSRLSLEDAIRKGVIDAGIATKLKDEKSYVKNLTCPVSRRKLSYKEALDKAVYDCHTGFRLMEAPLPQNFGIPSLFELFLMWILILLIVSANDNVTFVFIQCVYCQRSLEEEKKEHVKKAGDILNWVSKVTKTLSRGGQGGAEKSPFSKQQISSDEILAKQEEISEAAQVLQVLLAKHSDKMTEDERAEIEKQVKALQESHSLLAKEYERQQQEAKKLVDKLVEQKDAQVQLQEHKEKLQEICTLLTKTENKLIGQQAVGDSPAELQHYQTEYEELQKDMQAGASELAEIVKNTEKFLQEHGDKLSKEERALIEEKLKEAKSKFELLTKRAEESKKELEKAVTTAIKQETEKSAAVEQLEESKNKIEGLLDWLSHVDKEAENGNHVVKPKIHHNGTHHKDGSLKGLLEMEEVNGNLVEIDRKKITVGPHEESKEEDLGSQYQKVKAQHDKIVSQHQAVIIATQSAQALLEKQGRYLSQEEKEKLQKDIADLKAQYETTLSDSERKMKLVQTVQEELEKFTTDYSEFENWLQESKEELEDLETGTADFTGIMAKLDRQKVFSEDVISHKGDLRYITISGQRVLDAAKSCNRGDIMEDNNNINTLETCKMVQSKLDTASENFKSLHSECNVFGNNLKDLADKYQHYKKASSGLLTGLQASEAAVNKRLSEPIAVDAKNLQRQLEDTKGLCEQVSNHQVAVEKLKKAAEVILDSKGGLQLNKEEIQKPLDEVTERSSNLAQSVNDWNERLQVTLTRSLSVQDGLNEMLDWMQGVEKDSKGQHQVPLNSAAIQEIITKNNMIEQDIASRQSSINTMTEKVNKFMETADPSTASSLKAKMSDLSQRYSKAIELNKERISQMEGLKTKVELYEDLSEKVQSFLDTKVQNLNETDGPGKAVTELSQFMQETSNELMDHKKYVEELQKVVDELCVHGAPGDKALILEKVNTLLKKFQDLEETVKAKEEDVSSCQNQMDSFRCLVQSLKQWLTSVTEKVPAIQPALGVEELSKCLTKSKDLLEEWTLKAPEVQKVNSKGAALCNLISAVTSPAKSRTAVKSGRSVVNGGLPSDSKDHLTNKELAAVQKETAEVNQSYEDLGDLLKEKVCELEKRLSNMQQIQKETDKMMQWIQKMQTTAAAWDTPTDSDSVKAQIEQHKHFALEIKKNEKKVELLKDKLKGLLAANPDAPEAPKWKEMLDKIDSSWKNIKQFSTERQQTLEESSNDLTLFQTAEAQLKQWLVEKELMASVLGPLSIDPNMLKTQKQQVQILLNEFDARKQQYEQLNSAGQRILSRPGELPSCDQAVKEQLAAVGCKWESLTGQLNDRCERIDQAIVKSTQYQSLLKGLSDKLSALNNKLSSNMTVSSDPDAVKQKLETAKEIRIDIKKEMENIQNAKVLCEELSGLVTETYLKAELNRQLETIVKPFTDLEQKAGHHVEQLQTTFASSQKFHHMSEDFQSWLQNKRKEQNELPSISAKLDNLQSLITEQAEIQKALSNQQDAYKKLATEGENLLQKTEGEEKAKLQGELSKLKSDWEGINTQVSERQHKLHDCQQKAVKYKEIVECIHPWIEECHNKLSDVKLSIDPVVIDQSVGQVKTLQKKADKQLGMMEMLNSAAESLLSACQKDKEAITDENAKLNNQVELLIDNLHSKRDSLENMAQRLKDFQESVKETEKQLTLAHEQLEAHDSLGPKACSNKHLTIMQTQQRALQNIKPQVDLAKSLAQQLIMDASDAEGVCDLLLQAESLQQKHSDICNKVEEKCSFLETKLQGIGHFQNSIRGMFSQFAELDDELDSMSPVTRDQDTLQTQKNDINNFLKKLKDLITSNENANKTCKIMLATESSPDLIGIKRDLEALNKQCNKLLDRAKSRKEQIESISSRIEEFYTTLRKFSDVLQRAEEHEESQGAVGMETDVINQQLNVFTTFQKEEIEPLQVSFKEVNWLGQCLIQSAAKNTNTQILEQDLEEVNTRWNTLNKKVAQRAAQLQEALLHCGRFQDALESILSWLADTEDLVANQKPPSAEFKVVKAQIQEQKLLQRILDDRKPTIDVIKREGENIVGSSELADKEKVLKQLSSLERRWDELLKRADIRNRQLDGILVVAEQFHDTLEPLSEWLTTTEKKLANSEPIGTQTSKLLQQIALQKALQEDITAHNKILHQSLSIGQSLKALSSREDKEMVQEKLDTCQTRYVDIQEKSSRRCELLQQAHCNAQIFGDDEVELMNWLNEAHDKLSKLSVQDYSTDVLTRQHTELLLLQEDVVLRKQNVDQAIQNGLELLKQTTGDEVVVIQEKLDGIKSRYAEITKLSSKVSKVLEQALCLATRFHSTHEELSKWLDKVEVELKEYETPQHKTEDLSIVQERKKKLKQEAKSNQALLDSLNEVSVALLELVPWRARGGLDRMVTEDNERYRLVSDTITQMVEEIDAAKLRSQQFEQAVGAERTWIEETENKIMSLGDIRLEQDQTVAQLQVQKGFTMEILRHKDTIDELVASSDEIMNAFSEDKKQSMKNNIKSLVKKYEDVSHLNAERCLQLERAVSLVNQFWETYEELWPWLEETEVAISKLPAPALHYETLKEQQEEIRQLRELIAEHKPHIDKMNKTGPQLLELSPEEGFFIQEKYVSADALYGEIKETVKKRAVTLDEAISQSSQFHDKIEPTLESLQRIAERLRQPPSISAECEKIREQISDNKNVSVELEKLQPIYETLKMRGEEMIARSEGADKDISAKAVQDKLDQMVFIWEDIQALTEEREAQLLDVMELAEKFWCDHIALLATIKDTQDFIRELEEPGIDPSIVKQQQEAAEVIREEIEGLQDELDVVIHLGSELTAACGEPDKPVVHKNIDELHSAWETINKAWEERIDKLDEAMHSAVQYQDGLQALFDWVDIATGKVETMSPIGTDLETVKQQIVELKQFKTGAYLQQIEMERLNHQKELLLKKVTDEIDKQAVKDPMAELKFIWKSLEEKIINRQHKLEGALLALGPFQHALDELLTWMTNTEELLNEQKPVGGDPKAIEIELAKHHVLQNDVLAHKSTVETVRKAGNDLVESSAGEEASSLHCRLETLNQRWQNVLKKTEQRRKQLDSALFQAQGFHSEIEEMHQWLTETERHLLASKPVGGLPETAREQLNAHLELCTAFDAKKDVYKNLMLKNQQMLKCTGAEANVDQDINNLKVKWSSVETKLSERKIKLEEALNLATDFHNSLQDFINWLTQAEQTLTMSSPPSLVLDTVLFQIDEHKVFVTEVNAHRDQIVELDKTGNHLKYFSQKQDVVLIKNLLISVQSRWENVVQRSLERGRALDDARKRSKQFHEAFQKLMDWLEEFENTLDSELEIANDPDKIKAQLSTHKEFQKTLGAKHSVYDTTTRSGRSLKEKASLTDDIQKLDDMLSEIRDKWDTVCGKSVERQNKLEEALLFSGQFTDALQALIDWLYRVEPQLAEDQPVHGDIDVVMNLIDNHKVFQKELGKRSSSIQALKRSAKELVEGSHDDSSWVKAQMQELGTRWETVCTLSISKQTRLEEALCQAEAFHSAVHTLLEWLAEAEQALRFHGILPDDEESVRPLIEKHKEFMGKVEEKRSELEKGASLGEAILAMCHPDSITTIKHWITIIKTRFDEVLTWAKQHQHRLVVAYEELISKKVLIESLLKWLQWAETTLNEKDKEEIPQEIDEVKALIQEHQMFMEEMTRKQPDVDKVTKTYKRKVAESTAGQSQIPILGRTGRKRSPTPSFPAGAQAQIETKNPRINLLVSKWQQVWLLALERRRHLNDALDRLEELREFANFHFDIWRKKYMRWMNHKKSRVMDFFRRIDKDQDGKITRQEFIEGILSSKFPTSRLEMSAVADIFDRDGDGYIDYYEFVAALHPNKDAYKPLTDADKIEDEVTRQVAKCKCAKRFQVEQIGDNKYRFFLGNQFGDSQQLRLVRILRSTVMVRVGGGWMALDEFLVKNDPCRAKGRTNVELREKFMLPDGVSQSMTPFRPKGRRSRPSSRGASPNRSTSSPNVQPSPSQATGATTPKTPLQLTRNYGKPWLTNSKISSPCKSPEPPEYQLSSPEGTPIQGSKLRLPGYLSGKGFHSTEDTSILTTAASKVRTQFADYRRTPGGTGSKACSRSSSRRGSDASDFDISEIQSVCSEFIETVHESNKSTPRASSRSSTGKPSKIPTPQRRSPMSKISKSSKR